MLNKEISSVVHMANSAPDITSKDKGEYNVVRKASIEALPPFRSQLYKNAGKAKGMIFSALGENAVTYSTCRKWF